MFATLFKQKYRNTKQNKAIAKQLYACALRNTREEIFYTQYAVPDDFDGRFDLLVLHIFLILNRLIGQEGYEELSQALFDVTFKDMDQTLRELGIGDVGVPKHMKKMMKAFNGRMYHYQMAVAPESLTEYLKRYPVEELKASTLEEVLTRNIYSIGEGVDINDQISAALQKMIGFVQVNLAQRAPQDIENLKNGQVVFINETSWSQGEE